MGDGRKRAVDVQFDGKLRLEFHGAKITGDAGLLAFRELDEPFRLTETTSVMLSDPRMGKNSQHTVLAMLRQTLYGRLAGSEDVSHAERLRIDPAVRRLVASRSYAETGRKPLSTGGWGPDRHDAPAERAGLTMAQAISASRQAAC